MSEVVDALHRRLHTAGELKSVVRTMKTLAAISIVPYERAVHSLTEYYRTVELGLIASMNQIGDAVVQNALTTAPDRLGVVVFGSDQGMVGQFNEVLADYVLKELKDIGRKTTVWTIGERIEWHLGASNLELMPSYSVPETVAGITPLTAAILDAIQKQRERGTVTRVLMFHNQPIDGRRCRPCRQQLLPFDSNWLNGLAVQRWPTKMIPQVMPVEAETLEALLREYLFVSVFRACAESLASESASRLLAMQAAEQRIGDLIEQLQVEFNQARQESIDEELFDVLTGYEALA